MNRDGLVAYTNEAKAKFKADGWWRDHLLTDWLADHAAKRPDVPALVIGRNSITYAELDRRVGRLAAGLTQLGLGKDDIVAVQLPNVPEFVISYLALASIGAVMQTVHMPYREGDLEGLLGHSGARGVICVEASRDYPTAEMMTGLKDRLPALEFVAVLGNAPDGAVPLAELYADVGPKPVADVGPKPAADAGPKPAVVADDLNVMLYTSGTTSSPKGVIVSSYPFTNNARHAVGEFGVTSDDIVFCPAPFSHLYGLFALQIALCAGATNLLLPGFAPADYVKLIESAKPTILFTGPAHHAACRQAGLYDGLDMSSIRIIVCSGSAVPPDLARWVDGLLPNGKFLQLWGMTELQAGTYNRPSDTLDQCAVTAGRATPGNEIRVVDEAGSPLPAGEEGELQICGASVFPGYYNNAEANRSSFDGDWFKTGDLATMDEDGCLTITGRIKDIINRGGVKFNPADIEAIVNKMQEVAMSAVVPVKDEVLGEKACIVIQPVDGASPTLEAITAYLDENGIAKNKWPEQLELVDALPLTPTMKVIKSKLQIGGA